MATKPENAMYEARRKKDGWVRGPRITQQAAERIRVLAFINRMTPSEVATCLILGQEIQCEPAHNAAPVQAMGRTRYQKIHRLSDVEMAHLDEVGFDFDNGACR